MRDFYDIEEEINNLLKFFDSVKSLLNSRKSWAALLERKTKAITSYTICLFGENNTEHSNTSEHYSVWVVLENISSKDFTVSLQKILPIDKSFTITKKLTFEEFLKKATNDKYLDSYKFIKRKTNLENTLSENFHNDKKKLKI